MQNMIGYLLCTDASYGYTMTRLEESEKPYYNRIQLKKKVMVNSFVRDTNAMLQG